MGAELRGAGLWWVTLRGGQVVPVRVTLHGPFDYRAEVLQPRAWGAAGCLGPLANCETIRERLHYLTPSDWHYLHPVPTESEALNRAVDWVQSFTCPGWGVVEVRAEGESTRAELEARLHSALTRAAELSRENEILRDVADTLREQLDQHTTNRTNPANHERGDTQ